MTMMRLGLQPTTCRLCTAPFRALPWFAQHASIWSVRRFRQPELCTTIEQKPGVQSLLLAFVPRTVTSH